MDRRTFLKTSGACAVGLATGTAACGGSSPVPVSPETVEPEPVASQPVAKEKTMAITLPALPYDLSALEPYLSRENLELHHDKHHNAYVGNLNKMIEQGKADGSKSLEQIVMESSEGPVFNNAAQIWNHSFYWQCMKPGGGGEPSGPLADAIARDLGSFTAFKEQFTSAATSQFGSGWAWLVLSGGKLLVTATANADLPMKQGQTALLTCDVWEHAYYPTHKNMRPKYVEVFLSNLVNWSFVAQNLAAAG